MRVIYHNWSVTGINVRPTRRVFSNVQFYTKCAVLILNCAVVTEFFKTDNVTNISYNIWCTPGMMHFTLWSLPLKGILIFALFIS